MRNLRRIKISFITLSLLFISAGFQNCSKVTFSSLKDQSTTTGGGPTQTCTEVLQTTTKNIRILFMVDNSGSTLSTDPNLYFRDQTIKTFLNQYGSKVNFTYSFGYFGSNNASLSDMNTNQFIALSNINANAPNSYLPFGNALQMNQSLISYENTPVLSSANTPYKKAFSAIQTTIDNDPVDPNYPVSYAVVFMSDGMPNPAMSDLEIQAQIDQLFQNVAARNQLISLNTVYFGPAANSSTQAAQAMARLQTMALSGAGQFVDTNQTGGQLTIDSVVTVPGIVCTTK